MSERPLLRGPERPEWLYNPEFALHTQSDNGFGVGHVTAIEHDDLWTFPGNRLAGYDINGERVCAIEVANVEQAKDEGLIAYDTYVANDPLKESAEFLAAGFMFEQSVTKQLTSADTELEGKMRLLSPDETEIFMDADHILALADFEAIEDNLVWLLMQTLAHGYVHGRLDQINDMHSNGAKRLVKAHQLQDVVMLAAGGLLEIENTLAQGFVDNSAELTDYLGLFRGVLKRSKQAAESAA